MLQKIDIESIPKFAKIRFMAIRAVKIAPTMSAEPRIIPENAQ